MITIIVIDDDDEDYDYYYYDDDDDCRCVCVVMGKEIKKKMLSIVLGRARTFLLSTNIIICRYNSIIIFRCAFEAQYCE